MKSYILPLVLAVAMAFPILAWAQEAPEYSDAASAAVPTISVSGDVEQGEVISVTIEKSESALATTAAISTKGLQFLRTNSSFSTESHAVFMAQMSSVTYQYKVIGAPGTTAVFELSDVTVLLGEDSEEEPAPSVRWREAVTGTATNMPTTAPTSTATPRPTATVPTLTDPILIEGSAQISVSGTLRTGSLIKVQIGCAADGMEADVRSQGLEFVEVSDPMSSESHVVLVNLRGEQHPVEYTYRIEAEMGETISVDVENIVVSINGEDVDGQRSAWINVVGGNSGETFGLTDGLTKTRLPSGQTAIVGLAAKTTATYANDVLSHVVRPSSGRVVVQDQRGMTLTGNSPVTSGCRVVLLSDGGSATQDSAVLALGGDVLGTGTASISQVVAMARYMTGESKPTELQQASADFNQNGRVEISDLVECAHQLSK